MGIEGKRSHDYESKKRFERARRAAQILKSALPEIHSILLFGSTAREEARPNSDIDIAVLTNGPTTWDDSRVLEVLLNVNDDNILTLGEAGQFNPTVIVYKEFLEKSKKHGFYAAILQDGIELLKKKGE